MRLADIAPVDPGTQVAVSACPCCGGRVAIKVNKKGIAYFFCHHEDESGANCAHREHYGQKISAELRQLWHDNGGERVVVQLPLRPGKVVRFDKQAAANLNRAPAKPANINARPAERPMEARNGLFGG